MSSDSDYLVRNPKIVLEHFKELIDKKCLITAHFGEMNASFLTTIVDLDKENRIISLDCAPTETLNKQLLNSAKILFRTELGGIKVSFSGKGIQKTKLGNDAVLSMPIPSTIFWMQRRKYYRVRIPLSHTGSYCRLTLSIDDKQITTTFQLNDLSITGFSFFNPEPAWSDYLKPESEFVDCTLHLHTGHHASINFTVKNQIKVPNSSHGDQDRIGCLMHSVSPLFEASIQRYMQEIELQQKNIGHTG